MTSTKNNIQPSFLLKNINPNVLNKKYKQGYFNRPLPVKTFLPIVHLKLLDNKNLTKPANHFKSIQLSGQHFVELYNNNSVVNTRCDGCKCDVSGELIGYPIAYEEQQKLLDDNTFKLTHLFWIEGCFHSYECCLNYITTFNDYFNKFNLEFDVKVMFKYMYNLIFNNNILPGNDPKLLISNGGSMTVEEWLDPNGRYQRSNEVIKIPAQVVYHKV